MIDRMGAKDLCQIGAANQTQAGNTKMASETMSQSRDLRSRDQNGVEDLLDPILITALQSPGRVLSI